jgi:hypothetical protein
MSVPSLLRPLATLMGIAAAGAALVATGASLERWPGIARTAPPPAPAAALTVMFRDRIFADAYPRLPAWMVSLLGPRLDPLVASVTPVALARDEVTVTLVCELHSYPLEDVAERLADLLPPRLIAAIELGHSDGGLIVRGLPDDNALRTALRESLPVLRLDDTGRSGLVGTLTPPVRKIEVTVDASPSELRQVASLLPAPPTSAWWLAGLAVTAVLTLLTAVLGLQLWRSETRVWARWGTWCYLLALLTIAGSIAFGVSAGGAVIAPTSASAPFALAASLLAMSAIGLLVGVRQWWHCR